MWDPSRRAPAQPSPMVVRRQIAKLLRQDGHQVVFGRRDQLRMRSRYLTAVTALGVESWPWEDEGDLLKEVRELSEELAA